MCLVDTTLSGLTFFWEMCGRMLGWPLIGLIIPLEIDYKALRHQLLSRGAPDGREYRIWGVTPDDPCRLAAWRNRRRAACIAGVLVNGVTDLYPNPAIPGSGCTYAVISSRRWYKNSAGRVLTTKDCAESKGG